MNLRRMCMVVAACIVLMQVRAQSAEPFASRRVLGENAYFYRPSAIAVAPNGTVYAAGTAAFAVRADAQALGRPLVSFWVWKISADGSLQRIELASPIAGRSVPESFRAISRIVPSTDGGAALVVEFVPGQPYFIRLDSKGAPVVSTSVPRLTQDARILDMVPTTGGHFLLVGRDGRDALVMEIDANGAKVWNRTFDRGSIEQLTSVIAAANSYVIAGEISDGTIANPRKVWLMRISRSGAVMNETTFGGRNPSLAARAGDDLAITYDSALRFDENVLIRGLGGDLQPRWETVLLRLSNTVPTTPRIAATSDGFVVGGSKSGQLALWRVDSAGHIVWSYLEKPASAAWLTGVESLASRGDDVVAVSMMTSETADRQPNFKVALLRVAR